jgi:hypothetical protein
VVVVVVGAAVVVDRGVVVHIAFEGGAAVGIVMNLTSQFVPSFQFLLPQPSMAMESSTERKMKWH